MKITRIRIGLRPDANLRPMASLYGAPGDEAPPTPPAGEDGYWAEVIEAEGKFFYRVHGTTIEITEYEFHQVAKNPFLYYFSTALKLHNRIKHQSETDPVSAVSAGSSPDAATAETEAQPEAVKHSYGSQMAPRQFLRAVGAHWWGSDLDADRATDGEIEQFWPQVVASPITFDVREGGALWIGGMALPKCRAEWLALSISDHPTLENILDLAEQYSGVEYVLAQAYLELTNSDNGDPELVDPKLVRHWLRSSRRLNAVPAYSVPRSVWNTKPRLGRRLRTAPLSALRVSATSFLGP